MPKIPQIYDAGTDTLRDVTDADIKALTNTCMFFAQLRDKILVFAEEIKQHKLDHIAKSARKENS